MQYRILICFWLFLLMAGCGTPYRKLARQYTFTAPDGIPDYGNLDYWAAHPAKKDPSDSIPRPLQQHYRPDTSTDIFFLHPTTYITPVRTFGWNAAIDNPLLSAQTDYSTILYQASIFNEAGRVFAPRYRQVHYSSFFPANAADTTAARAAFELAYQDLKTAFLFYLAHFNNGRPFVIAAHSQGTLHAKRILKELVDGIMEQKLVAAYLVGMPVEPDYFRSLKACDSPAQTGCIVSWRTFKEGYIPDYVQQEKFTALVTNPITWSKAQPDAPRNMNKGGILLNFNKLVKKTAAARIAGGVLWTVRPRFFGSLFHNSRNYHIGDMNLYYLGIRENVKQRVEAFRKKQTGQ